MKCPFLGKCKKKVSRGHYGKYCSRPMWRDGVLWFDGFEACPQYPKMKAKTPANHEREQTIDEQEINSRFVKFVGGAERADRLRQLWRDCNVDVGVFWKAAESEGFTKDQIVAFLKLF